MRLLFRWALATAATMVLAAVAAFAVGASLPEKIEVTRTIGINRPPENIWWVLTDYPSLPLWHPQYRGARILSNTGERPVRWRATYTDGRSADVVASEESYPARYSEWISDPALPFSGNWKVELERRDLTTQVTAHSTVVLHRPIDRLFVYLLVNPELEVDHILEGLKRRVESATVKPTHATG